MGAYHTGTLADFGVTNFDATKTEQEVMELLGHFASSHWLDSSLQEQWFLKGANWLDGEVDQNWVDSRNYMEGVWKATKQRIE